MTTIVIFIGVIFIISLFKFNSNLKEDKKELSVEPLEEKFQIITNILNEQAFLGKATIIKKSNREYELFEKGSNQLINFHYSTGHLTITWKYKYYQKEIIHTKQYDNVRNLSIFQQGNIANDMIKEMNVIVENHKKNVVKVVNPFANKNDDEKQLIKQKIDVNTNFDYKKNHVIKVHNIKKKDALIDFLKIENKNNVYKFEHLKEWLTTHKKDYNTAIAIHLFNFKNSNRFLESDLIEDVISISSENISMPDNVFIEFYERIEYLIIHLHKYEEDFKNKINEYQKDIYTIQELSKWFMKKEEEASDYFDITSNYFDYFCFVDFTKDYFGHSENPNNIKLDIKNSEGYIFLNSSCYKNTIHFLKIIGHTK